jgi:hypothetical protein
MTIAKGWGLVVVYLMVVCVGQAAPRSTSQDIPHYKNDASWPKPFALHWVIGHGKFGVRVKSKDFPRLTGRGSWSLRR